MTLRLGVIEDMGARKGGGALGNVEKFLLQMLSKTSVVGSIYASF